VSILRFIISRTLGVSASVEHDVVAKAVIYNLVAVDNLCKLG
jgi:hypothetical protein